MRLLASPIEVALALLARLAQLSFRRTSCKIEFLTVCNNWQFKAFPFTALLCERLNFSIIFALEKTYHLLRFHPQD
jgi:hypothetical protein